MVESFDVPNPEVKKDPMPEKKRKKLIGTMAAIVAIVGLGILAWWLIWGRFYESTDDSYVGGNKVMLTPQTPGIITSIYADDTQIVEKGQIVVELDPTDSFIHLAIQKARLADTLRTVVQMFARVKELEADQQIKKADLFRAVQDFEHRKALVDSGGVSLEDFQHAEAALLAAYGALGVVEYQLKAAIAKVQNTTIIDHPLVKEAKNQVRDAVVRLYRCKLRAPVTGMIGQRTAQVGEWVNPAQPLLAIVPMDQMWVDANFKEVQLQNMRIGQMATMTADMYGSDVVFRGKVVGIAPGSGSVFSALPPQNATGNWIKIVQRLPVRISLDLDQLKVTPLRLGLTMDVSVDLHDTSGARLPTPVTGNPLYATSIFEDEEAGAEEIIETIFQENVNPHLLEEGPQKP